MSKLTLFKASAGSGKTHTLTQEYLKLAFSNLQAFNGILAVTFTNKASQEMKERILIELASIANKGSKNPHYKPIAAQYPDKSENEIKSDAHRILKNLLHSYSSFAISTIDSFTQKILHAFQFELGIQ